MLERATSDDPFRTRLVWVRAWKPREPGLGGHDARSKTPSVSWMQMQQLPVLTESASSN